MQWVEGWVHMEEVKGAGWVLGGDGRCMEWVLQGRGCRDGCMEGIGGYGECKLHRGGAGCRGDVQCRMGA